MPQGSSTGAMLNSLLRRTHRKFLKALRLATATSMELRPVDPATRAGIAQANKPQPQNPQHAGLGDLGATT